MLVWHMRSSNRNRSLLRSTHQSLFAPFPRTGRWVMQPMSLPTLAFEPSRLMLILWIRTSKLSFAQKDVSAPYTVDCFVLKTFGGPSQTTTSKLCRRQQWSCRSPSWIGSLFLYCLFVSGCSGSMLLYTLWQMYWVVRVPCYYIHSGRCIGLFGFHVSI